MARVVAIVCLVLFSLGASVLAPFVLIYLGVTLGLCGAIAGLVTHDPQRSHTYGWIAVGGTLFLVGPIAYISLAFV